MTHTEFVKVAKTEKILPAVTLWVPDLLNPLRIKEASEALRTLKLPALQGLLAKADRFPAKSQALDEQASYLFHQPKALAKASIMASVEFEDYDPALFWLRVDPVQMIADRDSLVLIPGEDLGITEAESRALLDAFNQHFSQDQVTLEYASTTAWYLKIKQPVDIKTHSIESVAYQPVNERYPSGNAASYWRQLLNETQMLFYTHPVNEKRRDRSYPEINSVWVWGEGTLDQSAVVMRPDAMIWSEEPYLKGLAKVSRAQQQPSPQSYQAWLDAQPLLEPSSSKIKHHLIRLDSLSDSLELMQQTDWLSALQTLEEEWLLPLQQALKDQQIGSLLLDFGHPYRYHLKPGHLRRFWRLKKPLSQL
ncbi:MAG: hypothetical protein ACQEQR_02525 [Pseudomonadota bacterium]